MIQYSNLMAWYGKKNANYHISYYTNCIIIFNHHKKLK